MEWSIVYDQSQGFLIGCVLGGLAGYGLKMFQYAEQAKEEAHEALETIAKWCQDHPDDVKSKDRKEA